MLLFWFFADIRLHRCSAPSPVRSETYVTFVQSIFVIIYLTLDAILSLPCPSTPRLFLAPWSSNDCKDDLQCGARTRSSQNPNFLSDVRRQQVNDDDGWDACKHNFQTFVFRSPEVGSIPCTNLGSHYMYGPKNWRYAVLIRLLFHINR